MACWHPHTHAFLALVIAWSYAPPLQAFNHIWHLWCTPDPTPMHSHEILPTIPTLLTFQGLPITPHDPTTGYICLPVILIAATNVAPTSHSQSICYHSTTVPYCDPALTTNPLWQPTENLQNLHPPWLFATTNSLLLISNALVQTSGQSSCVWVIAHKATPLRLGMGLAPGPVDNIYMGRAEAFKLFAVVTFLACYLSCYDQLIPQTTLNCFCNNLGIITTLTFMQPSANHYMPQWHDCQQLWHLFGDFCSDCTMPHHLIPILTHQRPSQH